MKKGFENLSIFLKKIKVDVGKQDCIERTSTLVIATPHITRLSYFVSDRRYACFSVNLL